MLLYKLAWLNQMLASPDKTQGIFISVSTSPLLPVNKGHVAGKRHKISFSFLCFKEWDVSFQEKETQSPEHQTGEAGVSSGSPGHHSP